MLVKEAQEVFCDRFKYAATYMNQKEVIMTVYRIVCMAFVKGEPTSKKLEIVIIFTIQ